jgi:hypothetical protein
VSSIAVDASIGQPEHTHAWRDDRGGIHATVRLGQFSATTFFFDSPGDARAVAAACIQAAEAMERLAAESRGEGEADEPCGASS